MQALAPIEALASRLYPLRWFFYFGPVLGLLNWIALHVTDFSFEGKTGVHYYMISAICGWLGLGFLSLIHWFSPQHDAPDTRPRYRQLYAIAVIYAVFSTLLCFSLAGYMAYAYAAIALVD